MTVLWIYNIYSKFFIAEFNKDNFEVNYDILKANFLFAYQIGFIFIILLFSIFDKNVTFLMFLSSITGLIIYYFLNFDFRHVSFDNMKYTWKIIRKYWKNARIAKKEYEKHNK